jgi:DNA-binding transcriptional LysR family regulator
MTRSPDPDLLRAFVEIVDNGTFRLAAKRVHLTQAAVSMQIRRLETVLGCKLFDRSGRGVRLTTDGEVFYDHARRILRSYREALAAFKDREIVGEIAIGLPDDLALSHLPGIVAHCIARFPGVRVEIVSEPSRRLLSYLAEGKIDIALVTEGEGASSGVLLHRSRPVWVCEARSRIHCENPVPLAIFHTGDVFRRLAIENLEAHGRSARVCLSSASFAGVRAAVHAGVAVAVVFASNVESGWRILGLDDDYPQLPELGVLLVCRDQTSVLSREISDEIARAFGPPLAII